MHLDPESPAYLLFADGPQFDVFQAIRVLERLFPRRQPIGRDALAVDEVVRFRSHLSLAFPPSAIHVVEPPTDDRPWAHMVQTFFGLTGPSGALPRHYTQLLLDLGRDLRGPERRSLGDWLALFDHRLVSLFFRAWEKYRFWLPYERGEAWRDDPDSFTQALFSYIGMGERRLRNRLRVELPNADPYDPPKRLAWIDDLALLFYSGFLVQRPRNTFNLTALLADYFEAPIHLIQFQGQWLLLEPSGQTCLGETGTLGVDAVAGDRVWDVQSKFRICIGPMGRRQFEEFLPDRTPTSERKTFFLLSQLTRYFVGNEFDFDVQLVLKAAEIPECHLSKEGLGPRLGWNTWALSGPASNDSGDAVFAGDDAVVLQS